MAAPLSVQVGISHQVKVVKYFGGFVHLGHGYHHLIVNVFLVVLHVHTKAVLQCQPHL